MTEFRQLRRQIGWTQAEAAEALGYAPSSRRYIAQLDSGEMDPTGPVLALLRICADPRFPRDLLPLQPRRRAG